MPSNTSNAMWPCPNWHERPADITLGRLVEDRDLQPTRPSSNVCPRSLADNHRQQRRRLVHRPVEVTAVEQRQTRVAPRFWVRVRAPVGGHPAGADDVRTAATWQAT